MNALSIIISYTFLFVWRF